MKRNDSSLTALLLCMGVSLISPANIYGKGEMAMSVMQQSQKITGKVADSKGEPIIGATIKVVGTGTGTITDLDGNFSLGMAPKGVLEISYVGYLSQKVTVNSSKPLDIFLF